MTFPLGELKKWVLQKLLCAGSGRVRSVSSKAKQEGMQDLPFFWILFQTAFDHVFHRFRVLEPTSITVDLGRSVEDCLAEDLGWREERVRRVTEGELECGDSKGPNVG